MCVAGVPSTKEFDSCKAATLSLIPHVILSLNSNSQILLSTPGRLDQKSSSWFHRGLGKSQLDSQSTSQKADSRRQQHSRCFVFPHSWYLLLTCSSPSFDATQANGLYAQATFLSLTNRPCFFSRANNKIGALTHHGFERWLTLQLELFPQEVCSLSNLAVEVLRFYHW